MEIRAQATRTVISLARQEARAAGVALYSRAGVALAAGLLADWCRSRAAGPIAALDPEAQSGGDT